jgi:hypothetical protein
VAVEAGFNALLSSFCHLLFADCSGKHAASPELM